MYDWKVISKEQSWALVGPGAVGLYYGGLLAADGHALHVLARSDAPALKAQGIILSHVQPKSGELIDETAIRPASVATDASRVGPVDVVIIAAKSTVNAQLIAPLKQLVEPGRTTILTLQNGMGNAEYYAGHFPENPILSGLCFVCVNRVAPGGRELPPRPRRDRLAGRPLAGTGPSRSQCLRRRGNDLLRRITRCRSLAEALLERAL